MIHGLDSGFLVAAEVAATGWLARLERWSVGYPRRGASISATGRLVRLERWSMDYSRRQPVAIDHRSRGASPQVAWRRGAPAVAR